MVSKPHTEFNKTKILPVIVYLNGEKTDLTEWDVVLWAEDSNHWYALLSSEMRNKRVRVVEREAWIRAKDI